ncbi:uncharacterized protein FOMMEDRAFT_157793 [Fomitiporia mediterranea MF3/22]|uniref:uncharacterized protein n=1 Tax=Fomitiporia mediterranea (strain MF3/22) TaxID=694068 RepID=UPI0004407F10|nr:uncharacterized protein FOMMEDRAFT_157793 [Fomitiporia mediterranea MF3/22]EJD00696.1 hypothetical protein FOMMEDRAFT_157793 [Fomitiporia mediterranea MF3/22]
MSQSQILQANLRSRRRRGTTFSMHACHVIPVSVAGTPLDADSVHGNVRLFSSSPPLMSGYGRLGK